MRRVMWRKSLRTHASKIASNQSLHLRATLSVDKSILFLYDPISRISRQCSPQIRSLGCSVRSGAALLSSPRDASHSTLYTLYMFLISDRVNVPRHILLKILLILFLKNYRIAPYDMLPRTLSNKFRF